MSISLISEHIDFKLTSFLIEISSSGSERQVSTIIALRLLQSTISPWKSNLFNEKYKNKVQIQQLNSWNTYHSVKVSAPDTLLTDGLSSYCSILDEASYINHNLPLNYIYKMTCEQILNSKMSRKQRKNKLIACEISD